MTGSSILVVDDEPDIRALVKEILEDEGFNVWLAENGTEARARKDETRPDLILLDIWMPDIDGITLLREWNATGKPTLPPVVMMSGHGTVETAVEATRLGAYDFLEKPLSIAKLLLTVKNALEASRLARENVRLRQYSQPTPDIIGRSETMARLREQIKRVANHNTPVLVEGESGTDKESVGRYLHGQSARADGPFVKVSVSALSPAEDDAEMFGRSVDGEVIPGFLDRARAGTLFLKDIADMDMSTQARLQNTLEKQSFLHRGGIEPQPLDVRLVVATRYRLDELVKEGGFRDDFYFQINVVPVRVPPLREHYEDVPELLEYYVNHFVQQEGLPYRKFATAAQNRLRRYNWPGNIRELKNLVQRLLILGSSETIELGEVESALGEQSGARDSGDVRNFDLPLREARERFEKAYLEYQLKQANGSVSKIAKTVGMERTHLYRKLKSLGIDLKS